MIRELLLSLAVGLLLATATTLLTYAFLRFGWRAMSRATTRFRRIMPALQWTFAAHFVSIAIYAVAYWALRHVPAADPLASLQDLTSDAPITFLTDLYFSATTYSSLGFGDVAPFEAARLLAGIEALNGLVLIGWSTTYTFLALREFWSHPGADDEA